MDDKNNRPSKKQYELLEFVGKFIAEQGYGPSYRDIMKGCNYSSVATVALHVNNLISKGYLRKNGRSARSLEVVDSGKSAKASNSTEDRASEEKWLAGLVETKFSEAEKDPGQGQLDSLQKLIDALKTLGLNDMAAGFKVRLEEIKQKNQ